MEARAAERLRRILVMGRTSAAALDLSEPYAVVSINDPGERSPIDWRKAEDGFCLWFRDIDGPSIESMTPYDAELTWAFLSSLPYGVGTLVVHCLMGRGRSI